MCQEVKARQGGTSILALPPDLSESLFPRQALPRAGPEAGAGFKGESAHENNRLLSEHQAALL